MKLKACAAIYLLTLMGCGGNSDTKRKPIRKAKPKTALEESDWQEIAHFGRVTTVWISKGKVRDKNLIAQILHVITRKQGKGMIWFFDSRKYTPRGVPMTDDQMLHWVGRYSSSEGNFKYIEISDRSSSPPGVREVETQIRPGYAE